MRSREGERESRRAVNTMQLSVRLVLNGDSIQYILCACVCVCYGCAWRQCKTIVCCVEFMHIWQTAQCTMCEQANDEFAEMRSKCDYTCTLNTHILAAWPFSPHKVLTAKAQVSTNTLAIENQFLRAPFDRSFRPLNRSRVVCFFRSPFFTNATTKCDRASIYPVLPFHLLTRI